LLLVVLVQWLALCHAEMRTSVSEVAEQSSTLLERASGNARTTGAEGACSSSSSEKQPEACNSHSLPDARQAVASPALLSAYDCACLHDPLQIRSAARSLVYANSVPPLPPAVRLALPLLI
jgi:hypothetical protein